MNLLPAVLLGCAAESPLAGVEVVSATIHDVTAFYMGAIVGMQVGGATLSATTVDGDVIDVPVSMSGPKLGLLLDISVGSEMFETPLVLGDLYIDDGESVPGDSLFGSYEGLSYSADALVGVHYAALVNENNIYLVFGTVDFGLSTSVAQTWLTIAPA